MGIAFERIFIVMLENSSRKNVLANPYMNNLRRKGVFLSNSFGVIHPSQPNYIASIAGDLFGFNSDDAGWAHRIGENPPDYPPITTIVDLLENKGLTWKAYAEQLLESDKMATELRAPYPQPPADHDSFARKHVPFLSFPTVTSNPDRMANIVHSDQFEEDLANGNLPNYAWYIPDLVNDGHDLTEEQKQADPSDSNRHVNIDNVAVFLQRLLGADPLAKFPPETLIVITFDESYPYHADYGIYTVLLGDMLEAGTTVTTPCNHYSLLRTVEDNFGIGNLGRNDAAATPLWLVR